jgi:hypothetical protein
MKYLASSLALAAVFSSVGAVHAENIDGAIAVGAAFPIVAYTKMSEEVDLPVVIDRTVSDTTWGVAENPLEVMMGYGLSDDMLLGGFLRLGGTNHTEEVENQGDTELTRTIFGIGPVFEYLFLPGGSARPFVGGVLSLGHESADLGGVERSRTLFGLAARGGVHIFLIPGLSLDPSLQLGFQAILSGEDEAGGGNVDVSGSGFNIGLRLGLTGWL